MPARGKRVASRQAQLNRRRRRQGRPAAELAITEGAAEGIATATTIAPPEPVPSSRSSENAETVATPPQPSVSPARTTERPHNQIRAGQGLAYNHLASELRRILILAGVVTVVLLGVSFAV